MSKTKIKVDQNLCIGCGACTAIAPEVFALDPSSGKSKVITQPKEINDQIKMAVDNCPVKAIKIEEEK